MMCSRLIWAALAASLAWSPIAAAQTQSAPDRIDPGLATRTNRPAEEQQPGTPATITTPPAAETEAASVPEGGIVAGAIRVDGGADLPQATLMQAISPFLGHRLSASDVQDLLTAVSGVARARGYLFARSSIPPQTIEAGVLHVRLDEGTVDKVRLTGDDDPVVGVVLAPLVGHAPKRDEVERQLMLAGDLPGVTIGNVRYAIESGQGVLIVPVTRRRIDGRASFDNRGLSALGPVRALATVNVNGVANGRDRLTVQGISTPIQPRELGALYGRYAYQLGHSGTEVALSGTYGRTRSGGRWQAYDPRGESSSIGLSIAQPVARGQKTSLWVMGEANRTAVDEWWAGQLSRRDRITTLGASINGYAPLAGGRLRAGAGVTQGVMALGATGRDNPLASRFDAGSDFTLFGAWANWTGTLSGPFSARAALTSQLSTAPLPAVEQITIGGPWFGRGYDFSERTGDGGVLGSAELRARLIDRNTGLLRWAQLYTFADGGYVSNHESHFNTGDLYSAGAGARLTFDGKLDLELEAAFPINEPRYDSGDKSPRLSVSIGTRF